MNKRKQLSKKIRFDVFKRDSFTCGYCGNTPPAVILEVDHIQPVALGGDNSEANLITSCFDCNRGKAANSLDVAPATLEEKTRLREERESQLKEYNKSRKAEFDRIEDEAWLVVNELCGREVNEFNKRKLISIKNFLKKLPFYDVLEAAEIASSAKPYEGTAQFRYFCGVCWNKIKGDNNG